MAKGKSKGKQEGVKDSKPKTFFEWLDGLLGVRNRLGSK